MNNFRLNISPVVKQLLIINVICFIGTEFTGMTNVFALYYPTSPQFKPYQIITHFFMHGNLMHIFFNMLGLVTIGTMLETIWGGKRFLQYYLICALGAAAIHLGMQYWDLHEITNLIQQFAANPSGDTYQTFLNLMAKEGFNISGENYAGMTFNAEETRQVLDNMNGYVAAQTSVPTVGASGAIYGLLAAVWYILPEVEFYMYFIPIPVKARYAIPVLLLSDLFFGFSRFTNDNVAHFAHIGGAITGFLLLVFWYGKSMRRFR